MNKVHEQIGQLEDYVVAKIVLLSLINLYMSGSSFSQTLSSLYNTSFSLG